MTQNQDEQDIRTLILQGNDEKLVRTLYQLIEVDTLHLSTRAELLRQVGLRYAVLASVHAAQLQDTDDVLVKLIEQRFAAASTVQVQPFDQLALIWYKEAHRFLTASIGVQKSFVAFTIRGCIHALLKKYRNALRDFSTALTLAPHSEQTKMLYLRGIVSLWLGDGHAAVADFERALQNEHNQKYSEAKDYVMREHLEKKLSDDFTQHANF